MITKISVCMALIVFLTASAVAESKDIRIGDDYAKAALRAVIYTNESGITAERVSILVDEADVEASTPAEEANLKELNRILGVWLTRPINDHHFCYQALKSNAPRCAGKSAHYFTCRLTVVSGRRGSLE